MNLAAMGDERADIELARGRLPDDGTGCANLELLGRPSSILRAAGLTAVVSLW